MTNDRFEEFLRSAVQDLDPVLDVPREVMWARIEEARRFRRQVQPVKTGRPRWYRWAAWPVAAAALLAIGIGIGRFSGNPASESLPPFAGDAPAGPALAGRSVKETPAASAPDGGAVPDAQSTETPARSSTSAATGGEVEGPYRLAALWHLSRAEGLLTSVAVGEVDDQLARWAGEMLLTTRLMLDSPAADDPRMARLLEDLELILVQIASATEEGRESEIRWIQEGLETNNVLPRLRAALPADRALIGT